jgi:DNA-binding LytR/AlgR family response regulator
MIKTVIIDDEINARELLEKMLNRYFPQKFIVCDLCESIDEAVKSIEKYKPDLVFLDIQMPNKSGFELFKEIKEIVGFSVSDHMRATANIMALKMALKKWKSPQIHHSDRGSQYISKGYIQLLESTGTKISMGKSAQENAYAERINRTIKEEYIGHKWLRSIGQLRSIVTGAVLHYNQFRPDKNLGMLTPFDFILKWNKMKTEDRPKITIFDDRKV